MPCDPKALEAPVLGPNAGRVHGRRAPGDMRLPFVPIPPGNTDVKADFCVIGSGAAGAIAASRLARPGVKVVVLESGSYFDAREFTQLESEMLPRLFKDGGAQLTMDFLMTVAQGRCLGGSTVINDAICFPPPEAVLQEWAETTGVDALRWTNMRPYVETIWNYLGVARVPDNQVKGHNLKLKEGCEKLAIANHGPNFRNCHDCCECGVCHLGCAYDTKKSMLITAIPKALSGGAEIYTDCEAWEINFTGDVATEVQACIARRGEREYDRLRVVADKFVIAAGTIASSGLLLRSGLGSRSAVGRGVSLHPSPLVMGRFDDPVDGHKAIPMAYHCHEFSVLNKVMHGGFMLESIFLPPVQLAAAMPSVGKQFLTDMKQYRYLAPIGILIRDQPTGQVKLGFEDEAVLDYQVSPVDQGTLGKAMAQAATILFKAGASSVLTSHRERLELGSVHEVDAIRERGAANNVLWMGSAHPQGGNPMGADPGNSVVDAEGKVYGTKNVYVCDASIFPSAVGVNPQITVMSMAHRIASALLK